ncbi:MAG: YhcH/YjgK/YiaL family protein [Ferruginibacter sp.]
MKALQLIRLYCLPIPFFMTLMTTCNHGDNRDDIRKWSDKKINEWFDQSPWSKTLPLRPDSSIDKRCLAEQIRLNPKSWEAAFKFIRESDFNSMQPGRYELSDDGTYANIADYQTRVSSRFEAHRKFIDIQMVSKGKEYVFITPVQHEEAQQLKPYDETQDIEFFKKDSYIRRLLSPENFMIFFPSDAHQPCMMVDTVGAVRKIVIKVPYNKGS